MKSPFTKLLFAAAAAASVLASCSGGGGDQTEEYNKVKMLSPRHLAMQGRMSSTITIEGVCYPRTDGSYSSPGTMVLVIEDNPLPDGPIYPGYGSSGQAVATFPAAQAGEIQHAVSNVGGGFTEGPFGRSVQGNSPVGDNSVTHVQLLFEDYVDNSHFVRYICDEFSLAVTAANPQPQGEPYQDYLDPTSNDQRTVQDYHMTYMGVITQGIIRITSNLPADGWPVGFSGEINLSGCSFVWECDETRVLSATLENNNPGQPIIGL